MTLRAIEPAQAVANLAGMESEDPTGMCVPGDIERMCREGQCFELAGGRVQAVYVIKVINGVAWVDAARGAGDADVTALLDGVITDQAQGLKAIGMQTARPGLVKKLKRHGWRVTGWIMRKEIQ